LIEREVKMKEDTLPKLLKRNYEIYGDRKTAIRHKKFGIWRRYSWKDYYEKAEKFCLGLISLGLKKGDKVSIIGENEPELFWAELGIQAGGAIMVGIFTDCIPSEIKYYLTDSESHFVVAHDQEQVDKILSIKDEAPLLRKIIYWEPKGLWNYREDVLLSFDQVLEIGLNFKKDHPDLFDQLVEEGSGEDVPVICYSSGTTGDPKGAMITNDWLVKGAQTMAELDGWNNERFDYLSFIPPAWLTEQFFGVGGHLVTGMRLNFPEKPETVLENVREVGPHLLFYGARMWESVNRTVQARMIDSTWLRRQIYKTGLRIALKVADINFAKKKVSLGWRFLYFLSYQAVIRSLRDRLGLSRAEVVYSAGGALSPDIIKYFKALGVEIRLFYGSTEIGVVTTPRTGDLKPESSGTVVPWAEIKISDEGEILAKTKYIYRGYYNNPEVTQKSMNEDGWYKTGDFGHIDEDGHLIVIDRMKDLKELATGKKVSPGFAESRLRFSPYIKDVIVVAGEDRTFVGALINIDLDNVGNFAEKNKIAYTTFTDLSQKPEVRALIREEIEKVNSVLPEWNRVRRFVNLHKELDADEAELTRTRKLRRTYVEDRYKTMIDALFSEDESVVVEAPVAYRDGKTGTIKTEIFVNRLD